MNTSFKPRALAVLRIPFQQDSVDYRAYAEQLSEVSVLTWALARCEVALPAGVPLVCVCSTQREVQRLTAAHSGGGTVFLHRDAPSEVRQCRELMDEYQTSRIIGLRLMHAAAPLASLLPTLMQMHDATGAALTESRAEAFANGVYIIDSTAVDALLGAETPAMGKELLQAVADFRADQRNPGRTAKATRWFRLELPELLNIPLDRWPERISIQTAADVRILREAVECRRATKDEPPHYIDAWKAAAISVGREERTHRWTDARERWTQRRVGSNERRRVLYISGSSYFHGASQSLCHLIQGLDRRVYQPFAAIPFEGVLTAELRRRGATVICPNSSFKLLDGETLRLARRIVREVKPAVAHGNYDIGGPLVAALSAADVPIVQHIRQPVFDDWKLEIHTASAIIAVSERVKKRLAVLDIDPNDVHVIWPGIDTDDFKPSPLTKGAARRKLGVPEHEFVVADIGRMARYKGHKTVVTAVGALRRATGRGHLLLVSALDGDRVYYSEVLSLIRSEGLAPHVTHIEFTKNVPTVLHASDSLAMMSNGEAFGRVAAEAMAVGRPTIVGDATGAAEIVEQGINGFVVPSSSTTALSARLAELAGDPRRAEQIGEAAVRTIQTRLSSAVCAERTMAIYDRLIGERVSASVFRKER